MEEHFLSGYVRLKVQIFTDPITIGKIGNDLEITRGENKGIWKPCPSDDQYSNELPENAEFYNQFDKWPVNKEEYKKMIEERYRLFDNFPEWLKKETCTRSMIAILKTFGYGGSYLKKECQVYYSLDLQNHLLSCFLAIADGKTYSYEYRSNCSFNATWLEFTEEWDKMNKKFGE